MWWRWMLSADNCYGCGVRMKAIAAASGQPMTYMHAGKQYIVVTVSDFRAPARIVALALP